VFELVSDYQPAGDQPQAIEKLTAGILSGVKHQTLLGVTGSGKTFTSPTSSKNVDKPTLVISHNKTLAAQLYAEFKSFFPNNAVEYFVSYFDYYQPEAYIPRTDTFIEKDSSRNEEIERLRLSTMSSLFSRRDVIVVASVSCIYGIGSKEDYEEMIIPIRVGLELSREQFFSPAWWTCNMSATTSRSSAEIFACAATRWKSGPPDARTACASNFSAKKSSASRASSR
jgi:excinuclease ABC subunit B